MMTTTIIKAATIIGTIVTGAGSAILGGIKLHTLFKGAK